MAMKLIACPSCGEEIEIRDLFEGVEIECDLCGAVLLYENGKFILLDTNEEFDPEDLEKEYEDESNFDDEEEFEDDEYFGDFEE
ncbi:hypothetical protein ICJ57_08200 [Geoglobus acetivorans]|nr:hypothetical protein [Geoglobus acetivorans]